MANIYEEEDIVLWKKYKKGDQQAKWDLLKRFDAMIGQYAAKHSNVLPLYVVEAKLKRYAIQAFDTYNQGKNTKLSTHVMNYMQKINRDNYTNQQAVRLPENLAIGYSRYMAANTDLTETLGRSPTTAELAKHLDWGIKEVERAGKRYHKEYVEGKQQFDAGVMEPDVSGSVIRFAYQTMSEPERYLFEHKTGYLGKPIRPMEAIRRDLSLTPYQFYQLQLGLRSKLGKTADVLGRD